MSSFKAQKLDNLTTRRRRVTSGGMGETNGGQISLNQTGRVEWRLPRSQKELSLIVIITYVWS